MQDPAFTPAKAGQELVSRNVKDGVVIYNPDSEKRQEEWIFADNPVDL